MSHDDEPGPDPPALPSVLAAYTEYEVLRVLGRGGMGVVYLARNRLTDRLEALKLRAGPARGEDFLHEVQAAARLSHPNIVAVHSARIVLGTLVLAMEYVDGCDLARLVAGHGPLPAAEACELIRQAALGVQHANDAGVIHRDIKPGNLILSHATGRPVVKVLDFGIARDGAGANDSATGTPAFAAPEQFIDPARVDARADVYALGGTLYFLLTGDRPFAADTGPELIRRHREDPPPRPDAVRPEVPVGVADLVERMLSKPPDDRPGSAAEVARLLARYAEPGESLGSWAGFRPESAETFTRIGVQTPAGIGDTSLIPTVELREFSPRRVATRRRIGAGVAAVVVAVGLCAGWASLGDAQAPADAPTLPATPPAPAGPVPLFDGHSLAGWVIDGGDPGEWRVEDGTLVTTGTKHGPRTWLLSEREYGDFRVRFEYRLEAGGNSGFAFRAVPGECPALTPGGKPSPGPYHQQIELSDDLSPRWANIPTGQVNGAAVSTGPALKPRRTGRPRPPGEWNRMEVEFRGQQVRVRVNGEDILADDLNRLIGMGSAYPALYRTRGRIGFQQQVKTVAFRNISVEAPTP